MVLIVQLRLQIITSNLKTMQHQNGRISICSPCCSIPTKINLGSLRKNKRNFKRNRMKKEKKKDWPISKIKNRGISKSRRLYLLLGVWSQIDQNKICQKVSNKFQKNIWPKVQRLKWKYVLWPKISSNCTKNNKGKPEKVRRKKNIWKVRK